MENKFDEIRKYNQTKIEIARQKIRKCLEKGIEPFIICIDIDDTLNASTRATEQQIEKINYRASKAFLRDCEISHPFFIDQESIKQNYLDLRNQILEEYGPYEGAIDYRKIHQEDNLYECAKETLIDICQNRDENTFIFLVSHRNPERESRIKEEIYYGYTDNIDGIITLPVFAEKYFLGVSNRTFNSKALYFLEILNLPPSCLKNCFLIDDSSSVRRDFKERGGNVIPAYLEHGYIERLQDDVNDRQRVITKWDPIYLSLIIRKIIYERNSGIEETKNFKVKKKTF